MRRRRKKDKRPALILRFVRHYGWRPGRVMSEVLEWIEVLIVAGALAFLVITFITVRMHVPTDSMFPTINGEPNAWQADSFFVDKLSYYFRSPKPGDIVVFWHTETLNVTAVEAGSAAEAAGLRRGDHVARINREYVAMGDQEVIATLDAGSHVFVQKVVRERRSLPDGRQTTVSMLSAPIDIGVVPEGATGLDALGVHVKPQRTRYVKRLIAVGGQTVEIRGGDVVVDGEALQGERFDRDYVTGSGMSHGVTETRVPEGHWFVLGDNSSNSLDSRYWGFVDERDFIGEPFLRVWPLPRFGPINGYFGSRPSG